ncbi:MAG: hypothetical protein JNN08_13575, partial [Bryobacterales bacterium]|nr:hypothetical protein [Bryobacterales bacterium]
MRVAYIDFGLGTAAGFGQVAILDNQFPIIDGRQCGFGVTISSADFVDNRNSALALKENTVSLFAKLGNLKNFLAN